MLYYYQDLRIEVYPEIIYIAKSSKYDATMLYIYTKSTWRITGTARPFKLEDYPGIYNFIKLVS